MTIQGLVPNLSTDKLDREARSYDFGRMTLKMPGSVVRPKSVEDISNIVLRAAKNDIPLAIRGGGHSQGGQSLTDGGLVIDTMYLNQVQLLGQDLVRAQGGSRWGKIVDTLHGTRQLPRVLADTTEVTVGGTLSAGGLGTTSHRYGMQIGQIKQLEVVTGTGERVRCSNTQNTDLFDAVRGGQGQFGIITDAWIRLRKAGERIRQYELLYRDFGRFESDFEQVIDEGRFDRLRAETRVHDHEIIMGAGIEYDRDLDDGKALEGLGYDKIISTHDTAEVRYAGMYPKWILSRRNYYPWRDWLMPWGTLRTVLTQPWLDRAWVPRWPGSWIGVYPIKTEGLDAPLFMHPKGERMFSYSILAILDKYERAKELAGRLEEVNRTLLELGGKSYLSGGVGYGCKEWEEHYGEKLDMGIRWKKEFDPKQIFRCEGMPFTKISVPQA